MVKVPKEQRRYCPYCRQHTQHRVKEEKKGSASTLKKGHRRRQGKIDKGYGGFPYEDPAHRTRGQKNPLSKKMPLVLTCAECGKAHIAKKPLRTQHLETV